MRISLLGTVATLTAVALLVPATAAVATPVDPSVQRPDLQLLLDRLVAADGPAAIGAIAEVREGSKVWRGSSGKAVRGGDQPAPVNGRFRAGSVTKTFTATVALQLVAEHRLRLTDTVEQWLPGVIAPGGAGHFRPGSASAHDRAARLHRRSFRGRPVAEHRRTQGAVPDLDAR